MSAGRWVWAGAAALSGAVHLGLAGLVVFTIATVRPDRGDELDAAVAVSLQSRVPERVAAASVPADAADPVAPDRGAGAAAPLPQARGEMAVMAAERVATARPIAVPAAARSGDGAPIVAMPRPPATAAPLASAAADAARIAAGSAAERLLLPIALGARERLEAVTGKEEPVGPAPLGAVAAAPPASPAGRNDERLALAAPNAVPLPTIQLPTVQLGQEASPAAPLLPAAAPAAGSLALSAPTAVVPPPAAAVIEQPVEAAAMAARPVPAELRGRLASVAPGVHRQAARPAAPFAPPAEPAAGSGVKALAATPPLASGLAERPAAAASVSARPMPPTTERQAALGAPHPVSLPPAQAQRETAPPAPVAPVYASAALPASVAAGIAPAEPVATPLSGTLAWSGAADRRLDPVTLAAVGAFVAPAASGAPSVRDALGGALVDVACSRLAAAFDPERREIALRGHVPDTRSAELALAQARSIVGPSFPVVPDVLILPRPQCGLIEAVERLGLPQSTERVDDPLVVGQQAQLRYQPFEEGEAMAFVLVGADFGGWLHLDYFDASGMVHHITPNQFSPPRWLEASETVTIGTDGDTGLALAMTAAPPFGKDLLVAIVATLPLAEAERSVAEPGGPYLDRLAERIAQAGASGDFRGEWAYIFVETFPQGARARLSGRE